MKQMVQDIFQESIRVKQETFEENEDRIVSAARMIIKALKDGRKVLFFGNGGSAADSQHVAAEFIGRFQKERRSLPALALTTDTSILTALGNDYSFDIVFARQIEGLGQAGDVAFGISTSGNSANVVEGLKKSRDKGMGTVALTGNKGGKMKDIADVCLVVPSAVTARVQESHSCIIHAICELVEHEF